MILLTLPFLAHAGAKVDRGPQGDIVTIRPTAPSIACVYENGSLYTLPDDTPPSMWLIRPEAWRRCNARVSELEGYPALVAHHEQTIHTLQAERDDALRDRQEAQALALQQQERAKIFSRQRWTWGAIGLGAGLLTGGVLALGLAL